jgi:hypothetical protein
MAGPVNRNRVMSLVKERAVIAYPEAEHSPEFPSNRFTPAGPGAADRCTALKFTQSDEPRGQTSEFVADPLTAREVPIPRAKTVPQ